MSDDIKHPLIPLRGFLSTLFLSFVTFTGSLVYTVDQYSGTPRLPTPSPEDISRVKSKTEDALLLTTKMDSLADAVKELGKDTERFKGKDLEEQFLAIRNEYERLGQDKQALEKAMQDIMTELAFNPSLSEDAARDIIRDLYFKSPKGSLLEEPRKNFESGLLYRDECLLKTGMQNTPISKVTYNDTMNLFTCSNATSEAKLREDFLLILTATGSMFGSAMGAFALAAALRRRRDSQQERNKKSTVTIDILKK